MSVHRPGPPLRDPRLLPFALLFLFSGAAGLIYQIVWERLLEIYFGVTQVSVTLIVGAYMAGLGLGSLAGGRLAQRVRAPLPLYGLLEVGIGLFGLVSLTIINAVGQRLAGAPYPVVFALSFLILLLPTGLMGMTLPLLAQSFITRVDRSGQVVGLLYGINTLGAALGAPLAAFVLIGFLGLDGANGTAVAVNLLVGLAAFALARGKATQAEHPQAAQPAGRAGAGSGYVAVLTASFLVGFIGLGYEMLWLRVLGVVNKGTVYLFPTILLVFLIALALGGYLWGRRADRAADPFTLFWKLEIAAALTAGLSFLLFYWLLKWPPAAAWLTGDLYNFQQPIPPVVETDAGFALFKRLMLFSLAEYLLPFLLLVFPAGLLLGGGLPVLDRIAIESPALAGRRVGDVHLANILGSVAGTLVISFALLPAIGSEWTYRLLAGLSLTFPFLMWAASARRLALRPAPGLVLTLGLLAALILVLPGRGQFYRQLFAAGGAAPISVRESGDALLALTHAGEGEQHLWIGGEVNSHFPSNGGYEHQVAACASAARPQRALVIGLGGGYTAYFLSTLPDLQELVVVELKSDLRPYLEAHFDHVRQTFADPRVTYLVNDGRRFLYANPQEKFDLIVLDPLRRYTAGHDSLYSLEALHLYRRHLNPGGVLCLWYDETSLIARTVAEAYPHVDMLHENFVAGLGPLRYDVAYLDQSLLRYRQVAAQHIHEPAGHHSRLTVRFALGYFRGNRQQILQRETGTPLLRDHRPLLEYYYFRPPPPKHPLAREATILDFLSRLENCDEICRRSLKAHIPHAPSP